MPKVPKYNLPKPSMPIKRTIVCGSFNTVKADNFDKAIDRVVRKAKEGNRRGKEISRS